jgi:hypothetical protein
MSVLGRWRGREALLIGLTASARGLVVASGSVQGIGVSAEVMKCRRPGEKVWLVRLLCSDHAQPRTEFMTVLALQCVAPGDWLSSVWTMTLSTCRRSCEARPAAARRAAPQRHAGKAPMPLANRLRRNRSRAATALFLRAAAQPNTIRARNAKACAVLRV